MIKQAAKLIYNYRQTFKVLLLLDLIIVLLHLLFGKNYPFFNVDFEQNLPTWYQSLKLLLFATLFFIFGFSKHIKLRLKSFILPLAFFLAVLGLDELLQIHENIYRIFEHIDWLQPSKVVDTSLRMGYRSSLWLLYYLPFIAIFILWIGYWFRYFQTRMKSNVRIIAFSGFCFLLVFLTEILSSTGLYWDNTYYFLITLEELGEMLLASTLVLLGSKLLSKHIPRSN